MKHIIIVVFVVAIFGINLVSGADGKVRFDNYHVYEIIPQTREQLQVIKKLEGSAYQAYIFLDGVHYLNSKINVVVAPHAVANFVKSLMANSIRFNLVDTNAQASLEDDVVADPNRRTMDYSFEEYHELNDTYRWMRSLEHKYEEVKVLVAGQTYEGRDILALRISYGPGRKAIFVEGGIHAREWISPATTAFVANELLTSSDREIRMIAESFDWYLVPHVNADGYVYTHSTNRLWRKTRTPYGNCSGADPNRNWSFHWNEIGSSKEPCSDRYAGPSPFSEIETKSLSKFIESVKDKLFLYISFHSFAQLVMFPYGFTQELPPNYPELYRLHLAAIDAIGKRYGTKYKGGTIYDAIFPASGSSVDHVYAVFNVTRSFCFELRPNKSGFWRSFILPADQIIPTGLETLDGLMALIKEAGVIRFL